MVLQNVCNYNTSNSIGFFSSTVSSTIVVDTANVSVGVEAVTANNYDFGTAIGYRTGYSLSVLDKTSLIGSEVLASAKGAGAFNQAIGAGAFINSGTVAATFFGNTAIGAHTLINTTGPGNTAIGCEALSSTTRFSNTAAGYRSGSSFLESFLTSVGTESLYNLTTIAITGATVFTSAVGYRAMYQIITGRLNTAVGSESLSGAVGTLFPNAQAASNTAIGYHALYQTQGSLNVAVGAMALESVVSGSSNVAVGIGALQSNLTSSCTAVGAWALNQSVVGQNVAVGYAALYQTTGTNNTAVGFKALYANSSGASNTSIGHMAGFNQNGNSNLTIGADVIGDASDSGVTRIGGSVSAQQCFIGGIYGTASLTQFDNAPMIIDSTGRIGALPAMVDGQLIIGSSTSKIRAATLTGRGIAVTNSPGSIKLDATAANSNFGTVSGLLSPIAGTPGVGYIVVEGSVVLNLPAAPVLGQVISLTRMNATNVQLCANTNNIVIYGNTITQPNGTLTSLDDGDVLNVVAASTSAWIVYSALGNWDVG